MGRSSGADVGVDQGAIVAVGDLSAVEAARTIDADGLSVAPGFVDTHTHTEGTLLLDPQHENGIRQAITPEIFGLDGLSYAPSSPAGNYALNRRYREVCWADAPVMDTSTVTAFRARYHRQVAVNTAYLVPMALSAWRLWGSRTGRCGPALEHAQRLVRESIEQGAVGLSSGLNYYPCACSDLTELVALASTTREAGGIHVIELRTPSAGRDIDEWGLREAMEVGRRLGLRSDIAHHRTQPDTAGDLEGLIRRQGRAPPKQTASMHLRHLSLFHG